MLKLCASSASSFSSLVWAAFPRDRLRVVHGRIDELVEISVLNVEGLAHMGTACLQELGHAWLVNNPVKPRLHRFGRTRDLTERKRRGKNLDENRFPSSGIGS